MLVPIASIALALGAVVAYARSFSTEPYRGPVSDHFDGERFFNSEPAPHGFGAFFRWVSNRKPGPWRDWVDAPPGPKPPERVGKGELRVTWVNHATVLVQLDGVNVLTDPVWSYRVSPVSWAGPRRHRPPGIRFEELPPIDAVVVSHNHYDHMDVATLARLRDAHRPRVFSALGNGAFLDGEGIPSTDLDWWQSAELANGVTVTSVPAKHFSSRGPVDRDFALWGGFVIRGAGGAVYVAGDTGYGSHFAEIGRRLGPMRVALLPIGAFLPRWFMSPVHMGPAEALRAARDLRAEVTVPIHYGTFPLGDDAEDEPLRELERALAAEAEPKPRVDVLGSGEGRGY